MCVQTEACDLARCMGSEVQHPILARVRQCSANPDQVADFFRVIFSPSPHDRVRALHHPWCAEAVSRMFAETGTSYEPPPLRSSKSPPKPHSSGLCAALLRCFCCGTSARTLDSDAAPLGKPKRRLKSWFSCVKGHQEAEPLAQASQHVQSGVVQADKADFSTSQNAMPGGFSSHYGPQEAVAEPSTDVIATVGLKPTPVSSKPCHCDVKPVSVTAAAHIGKDDVIDLQHVHLQPSAEANVEACSCSACQSHLAGHVAHMQPDAAQPQTTDGSDCVQQTAAVSLIAAR